MSRITTKDCERVVSNRFELVLLAAQRARELARVSVPPNAVGCDSLTVTALREIAAGRVSLDHLRASQVRRVLGPPLAIRTTTPRMSEGNTRADPGPNNPTRRISPNSAGML
jgi:DNA-directed RNA polymerase omega subunit